MLDMKDSNCWRDSKISRFEYIDVHIIFIYIPDLSNGTILDSPFLVADGKAIIGFPLPSKPSAAPLMKSTCPPKPEYILVPIESDDTCPVKSTSIHELIAVIFGCRAIMPTNKI